MRIEEIRVTYNKCKGTADPFDCVPTVGIKVTVGDEQFGCYDDATFDDGTPLDVPGMIDKINALLAATVKEMNRKWKIKPN